MHHHHQRASQVALAPITEALRDALLHGRRRLRHRAPRDPYVKQLRKDIAREHAKPAEMIARVLMADLEDGAPLDDVLEFPRRLIGYLEAFAAPRPEKPLAVVIDESSLRETMKQGPMDCVQLKLARDKSPETLAEAEAVIDDYDREQERLRRAIRQARMQPVG